MSTKLSNNEIQMQLTKEEVEQLKKDKQKQFYKVVKK
jgi:hypothetical protein